MRSFSRWELEKTFTFEAAHQLMYHDGKCARLHGHSWKLTVYLAGDSLEEDGPKRGMLVDYGEITEVVKNIVDNYLDHHHLNVTLETDSPTSEFVAQWIYQALETTKLSSYLQAVTIHETCTAACTYMLTSFV